MTDEQLKLIFGCPDFMKEYFERFARAMALAVDAEIMGEDKGSDPIQVAEVEELCQVRSGPV